MTNKFYDMGNADETSGGATAETSPQTDSIAAIMAREGVKSTPEEVSQPFVVRNNNSNEDEASSPVATTKESASKSSKEDSSSRSEASVPEHHADEGQQSYDWLQEIKGQNPEDVLKALGYDEKLVSFMKDLKEVDPKMVGFLDHWKSGGDLKEYLNEASKDFSAMPAEEVMRHQLRQDYPRATEEQLDILYKKEVVEKYNLNSYDEDEVNEGKLLLEAKADKYRDDLQQLQQEKILPNSEAFSQERAAQEQRMVEYANSIVNSFTENPYTKEVLSKNVLTIGEGADKFSFQVNGKELTDLVINGDTTGDLMFETKKGSDGQETLVPKAQHQLLVAAVNKYGEKFIVELAKHYKSLGGKSAIDPIDNARPIESRNTSYAESEPTTVAGAMAKYGRMNSGG